MILSPCDFRVSYHVQALLDESVKTRKSRYLHLKPAVVVKVRGALVVVDNAPIRHGALRNYDEARVVFQKVQEEIGRFHRSDKPQFERWLRDHFSEVIREVTNTRGEVSKLQELVFEVETRTWLKNQSFAAAYRDVMERRARNNGKSSDEDLQDLQSRLNEKLESSMAEENPESLQPPTSKLGAEKLARLKTAYRSMARRFHPDCNADLTPAMLETWYEAQRAYLAGDVELLESIDAAAQEGSGDPHAHSTVALILHRTDQLLQNHKALLRKVEDLQRDPAWGFGKLTSTTKLKKKMAKELPEELKSLHEELKKLQRKINAWKEDAERYYPGFKEAHGDKKGKTPAESPSPKKATASSPSSKHSPTNRFNRRGRRPQPA